jgi:aldose 1-epimerase
MPPGAHGQTLMPWPNRIGDGKYSWDGADHQLPITEPDKNCAIHGLVRWVGWTPAGRRDDSVTLTTRLHPQTGWSWVLDLSVDFTVSDGGITVRQSARNLSDTPAPFAAGAHPYLAAGTDRVDECTLEIPASEYLASDERLLPTGVEPVDGTDLDFRTPRRIGGQVIDQALTDLERGADGLFVARLTGRHTTEVWLDESYPYFEIFSGDTLPDVDKRRRGFGAEPMTSPPNAFATGTHVVRLEPGATWTGAWGIRLG